MNRETYDEILEAIKSRLVRQAGWIPHCLNCWLRRYTEVGAPVGHVEMNVRSAVVATWGNEYHEDIALKCPECSMHLNFGIRIEADEYDLALERRSGDGVPERFDAANDAPSGDRDELLEELGYIEPNPNPNP